MDRGRSGITALILFDLSVALDNIAKHKLSRASVPFLLARKVSENDLGGLCTYTLVAVLWH